MTDPKLSKFKDEYMNIPIPHELPSTVHKSIQKGERIRMRKNRLIKWAGAAAAMVLIFTATLNLSPAAVQALSDVPIIKNIVSVLTIREYNLDEDNYNANLKVPAVKGLNNQELASSLNDKYLAENKKLYQEFVKDIEEMKANGSGGHMGVDSGYVVKTDNEQILSIGRWVVNTAGSSSTTMKYDTIDKEREVLITLPSLFRDGNYVNVISQNIEQQMRQQMKADPNKMYWVSGTDEEQYFEPFKKIAKNQNFYINNKGKLVISFDKYEVAPGYMGVVEFVIPTDTIAKLLVSNEYIK
ncbi:Domain of unknown function DUF4163 [Syntrophomonas zehnderi OL-4]|uniref:Uncharacterized protein n=1 Tax=Syntrophomonas zehnderi OL-4 TaxID=690567 RepID=A0A0E4GEH4_9FIRM|nr:DUF3298 domain-containing protein [Syntrophomonas zehnderi]CFX89324.1 Domain of unknown function DUF4163 [Syntrophomonas zehnderi OL-4]